MRAPLKLLREKLLSSSTEFINFFQYVSDFCTKLFRACQLAAKANLSCTQKSMREKCDVDAVERDFKPKSKGSRIVASAG